MARSVRKPLGPPMSSGIGGARPPSLSAITSAPVSTASTPSAALAFAVSTRVMRACACGDMTTTP
jgi:hypothetical protein